MQALQLIDWAPICPALYKNMLMISTFCAILKTSKSYAEYLAVIKILNLTGWDCFLREKNLI